MAKRPEILKNINVFIDGAGKVGVASELTLPKITYKTEEFRGGGMNAPLEIPMGMEKLEASFSVKEYVKENFELLGAFKTDDQPKLIFRGSIDTGDGIKPIVITMSGYFKEADFGNWKAGDNAEIKYAATLHYYKLAINDEDVMEIDVINMVERINGKDRLEAERKALGI